MKKVAIFCIKTYQYLISPLLPQGCRFIPTCSEYSLTAFDRYGFINGAILTFKRILRCNPFCKGGYDPVPTITTDIRGDGIKRLAIILKFNEK